MSNNYIDRTAAKIGEMCDMSMVVPDERRLLRAYALLCHTRGKATNARDVHDAWSAWRLETCSNHPCLVPFARLTPEKQALDAPYVTAIRTVAAKLDWEAVR